MGVCLISFTMCFVPCKKDSISSKVNAEDYSSSTTSINANLVAWYKFTKGSIVDYSGKNNHLTAFNVTLANDYLGRPNNAYYFNGYNSSMRASDSPSLNPSNITIVVLIKPTGYYTGFPPTSRILMKGIDDQSSGDYYMGLNDTGSFYGQYGDNQFQSNGVSSPDNVIQLNNWYKLAYTYDGNAGKLYMNDTLVGKVKKAATFTPNTDYLRIGTTGRGDFPYWFNGVIDEIRIYNIALSPSQIIKVDGELGR